MDQPNALTMPAPQPATDGLLDLSAPERSVRVREAGRVGRHIFRPLALSDWLRYLADLKTEFVYEEDSVLPVNRSEEAAVALWDGAVLRVEGYHCGDDWKERMPVGHKAAAVNLLQEVYVTESADPFDLQAEGHSVVLEAAWNESVYERLVHRFRLPAAAEELSFRRLQIRFYRMTGQRGGVTRVRVPAKLKELCQLYDAMILSTEGYAGFRSPKDMDPLHKQAAVTALFTPPERSPAGETEAA